MQERDNKRIMRDFGLRKSLQLLAIAATLVLLLFLVLLHKHPDLIGEFSKDTIFTAQIVLIAMFIGFSAINWRCPSCKKYLGNDINRRICKHCGTRLR
jgi:hypothetical protein